MAGRAVGQVLIVEYLKKEVLFYVAVCSLILCIILFLVFRTILGILIPLVSVLLGLGLFIGFMSLTGTPLDIMSTLFPPLMLIIGMSDVIHIMSKYIDEQHRGVERFLAMKKTIKEIGFATLLTSLTTAIGFLALLSSRIEPIRLFGVWAAIGVSIAYLTVIGFTCMWLLFYDGRAIGNPRVNKLGWSALIQEIFKIVSKRPGIISVLGIIVIIVSIFGISRVSTNYTLLSDVPKDSKLREDFKYFENVLAGARPLDIAIIPAEGKTVFSPDVMRATEAYEEKLREFEEIKDVVSPVTFIKEINKAMNGGVMSGYKLPDNDRRFEEYGKLFNRLKERSTVNLTNDSNTLGRLTAKIKDIGSDDMKNIYQQLQTWEDENIDPDLVDFKYTGKIYLVDKNTDYLVNGLFYGLGFALIIVGILMGLLFRDFKMVFISFVPNILPLLVTGGVMGILGIELKSTTSIIFTIAFGVAVDDTIHFLSRYRQQKMINSTISMAIRNTFKESGKAIMLTTLILVCGFAALAFSKFTATFYVGVLISITMITALLADLFILPLLLYFFDRKS